VIAITIEAMRQTTNTATEMAQLRCTADSMAAQIRAD
jgi:hypothetical protein